MILKKGIVESTNFSLYYGKKQALKDVCLSFPPGRITAIMGPSGCGKTTMLRSINRMNEMFPNVTTSGQILFNNENIYNRNVNVYHLRRRIGMVFQKPNPFPMSIFENVAYGLRIHRLARGNELDRLVKKALKMVNLWGEVDDRLKENALTLSGGQQQRLCIARAIAIQPEVLLLDEPTSALDPVSSTLIEKLLQDFVGRFTVIIVTHSVGQTARVAEYAAFMMMGDVVDFGKTTELFTNPQNELTEKFLTGKIG